MTKLFGGYFKFNYLNDTGSNRTSFHRQFHAQTSSDNLFP